MQHAVCEIWRENSHQAFHTVRDFMTRSQEFLTKLACLCEEYNATFSYTTNDDGIHIRVDGTEVFVGWLFDPMHYLTLLKGL